MKKFKPVQGMPTLLKIAMVLVLRKEFTMKKPIPNQYMTTHIIVPVKKVGRKKVAM